MAMAILTLSLMDVLQHSQKISMTTVMEYWMITIHTHWMLLRTLTQTVMELVTMLTLMMTVMDGQIQMTGPTLIQANG